MFASVQCNDFVENSENTERSDDFDFHGTQNVMCRVPLMLSCRGSFQEVFWICVYNFLAVPSAELNELLMCHEACAASLYVRPFIIIMIKKRRSFQVHLFNSAAKFEIVLQLIRELVFFFFFSCRFCTALLRHKPPWTDTGSKLNPAYTVAPSTLFIVSQIVAACSSTVAVASTDIRCLKCVGRPAVSCSAPS